MIEKKTILVTGATGFIGRNFCASAVRKHYTIIALSRNANKAKTCLPEVKVIESLEELPESQNIHCILNLAGEPLVSSRWTKSLKQKFIDSRVGVTNNLFKYFSDRSLAPEVVISGSAVGYYGHGGDKIFDEETPFCEGYSHNLCSKWEDSAFKFDELGSRVCYLRTGIVLGNGEGALSRMVPPFKAGLGGRMGDGKQWMPWIHINDQIDLIFHCIDHAGIVGGVNSCSPNPVTNLDFTRALGKTLSRPVFFNMPSVIALFVFGEMAQELLLTGQRALPRKALETGFEFKYPKIQSALNDILN